MIFFLAKDPGRKAKMDIFSPVNYPPKPYGSWVIHENVTFSCPLSCPWYVTSNVDTFGPKPAVFFFFFKNSLIYASKITLVRRGISKNRTLVHTFMAAMAMVYEYWFVYF